MHSQSERSAAGQAVAVEKPPPRTTAPILQRLGPALRYYLIRMIPVWLHPYLRSAQYGGTLGIGAVLRMLPGSSREFGPPRRYVRALAELKTDRAAVHYKELHASEIVRRSPPTFLQGAIHPEFFREMSRTLPAAGVAIIEQGRVLTRTGAVIAPDDQLVCDVSDTALNDNPLTHPIFMSPRLPTLRRVEGNVAVLTSYRSSIYYHWLFDTLTRLALVRESGIRCDKYVVSNCSRFQREALLMLGIADDQILSEDEGQIEATKLIVPSLPGTVGNPPKWACDFLRQTFLGEILSDASNRKRIYVSRAKAGTRRILNEGDLVTLLRRHGFETVILEDLNFAGQIRLFESAQIVVSSHGSGLANLAFCRPGTFVVELFSPNYMNVMYWSISNQLGFDYYYIKGHGRSSSERGRRIHEDILINTRHLEAVLADIDARAGSIPSQPKRELVAS